MSKDKLGFDQAKVLLVQKHQNREAQQTLAQCCAALETMSERQQRNADTLDSLIAAAEAALGRSELVFDIDEQDAFLFEASLNISPNEVASSLEIITCVDTIDISSDVSWESYLDQVERYTQRHGLTFADDPFATLLSPTQRIALERRIRDEFSLKSAACDQYDYLIAGTCGIIGGLVDILFVGLPGKGILSNFTDDVTNQSVQKVAGWLGWDGPKPGSDPTSSAIGWLERKYKVNYDHRHGGDVDYAFPMSTKNHHIKSLGHSPDIVGLFFSIIDQFNSQAHFMHRGKLITVDTSTFELRGETFPAKIFSAFVNWLGHLASDVAGSSGAVARGSGIPIPFFSLLQVINVGQFGQHRQTFATVAVQVFEQGYDLRHGMAMAIPVLITELLTRITWTFKMRFFHSQPWSECVPTASQPELRRMLLIAHGSLCLMDASDAALRSGGEIIQFLLRSNMIAWARFGTVALKEMKAWYRTGGLDVEAVDSYLDEEYSRLYQECNLKYRT